MSDMLDKFKIFVAQILTVSKDDIRKAEDTATDLVKKPDAEAESAD